MSSPRVLVVLGMHKSGTSLIAATLHGAGIAMVEGDAQGPTVERASTRAFNKAVLGMGHAHSLSIAAPLSPARLQPQQQAAARRLLAGLTATTSRQTPAWGFKDPRTLLTCCSTTTPSSPATQACIPRGRLLLLAAGTKPHQKGFDLLLEAFEAIAPRHPHWDLAIVGLDPQRIEAGLSAATLHRRAHAAGLATRVHVVGPVADMAAWYALAPQGSPRPFRSRCLDRSGGAAGRRHPAAQGSRVSCHRRSAPDMARLIQQLDRDRTA